MRKMVWLAVFLFIVMVTLVKYLKSRRISADLKNNREPLPFDFHYESHYKKLGVSLNLSDRVWSELARVLKMDPLLMRPEDRLEDYNQSPGLFSNTYDGLEDYINDMVPCLREDKVLHFQTVDEIFQFILHHKLGEGLPEEKQRQVKG